MFCGKCGAKMEDNARFCPNCGNKMQELPQQNTAQQTGSSVFEKLPDLNTALGKAAELGADVKKRMDRHQINSVVRYENGAHTRIPDETILMVLLAAMVVALISAVLPWIRQETNYFGVRIQGESRSVVGLMLEALSEDEGGIFLMLAFGVAGMPLGRFLVVKRHPLLAFAAEAWSVIPVVCVLGVFKSGDRFKLMGSTYVYGAMCVVSLVCAAILWHRQRMEKKQAKLAYKYMS